MAESLNMIAQRNTLGIVEYTVTPYALKGQHIVENKYIALSVRNFLTHFPTQRDTLGYRIFGFQPKPLYFKMLNKLIIGSEESQTNPYARSYPPPRVSDWSGYPASA